MANMDEKVKKSSSQSLIKMQAAQMVGSHLKEFHSIGKDDRKSTFKTPASTLHKKTFEPTTTASKLESGQSKKLIFSFKKEAKQKVTPPNVSN